MGHWQQRSHASPVLEQIATRPGDLVQPRDVVGAQPAEQHEELRAREHVDGVELQEPGALDHRPDMTPPDGTARPRPTEALRVDGEPPSLLTRQLGTATHAGGS